MIGTSLEVTLAMEVMPPRITAPTSAASRRPKIRAEPEEPSKPSSPPVTSRAWAMVWLAWNMLPPMAPKRNNATAKIPTMPLENTAPKRSKAIGRYLNGPPVTVPSSCTSRYFTPSVHSTNLVHMPSRPATIIQNVAPGPPMTTAAPTPAMLPRPTVPETAEDSAWKWVTSPGSLGREYLPRTRSSDVLALRNWMPRK